MLPKNRKIARKDFPKDQRVWVRRTSIHFSLSASPFDTDKPSAFSVVVSGKVAKRAVVRNKIRRRVYAVVHGVLPRIVLGKKVIIFARAGADTLSYPETAKEIKDLFASARLALFS